MPSATTGGSLGGGGVLTPSDHVSVTSPSATTPSSGVFNNETSISVISSPNGPLSPDQAGGSSRPPLPPPPRHCIHGRPLTAPPAASNGEANVADRSRPWWKSWNRKYVLLCGTCGMSSVLLGTFYLVIFFVLRSYTSSLEFFQTMPTYIPACLLIVTGLLVLFFMRRKSRLSILIKIAGFLCLVCAVVCVVVTVTTTVLHMNRLQTLRECTFYTQLHSCTCLPFTDEEPFELKLDISITTCDVIHGPLYSCLRAMFGVSVIGILVSIFSCMLVYQLLSHEKKKMYWEQLENRRRLLYRRNPASSNGAPPNCNCCDEYGFVPSAELYPWRMWDSVDERYWNGGTQLYSHNGEDSSNASRSVLLGGANPNGGPSLWLPWGGAWGAAGVQAQTQFREIASPADPSVVQADAENFQRGEEHHRPQATGVLLRPFLPRGLEARFGLRRQPPPPPGSRRPLSDPGVALQMPRYPFSEAFLPPLPYEGLEAFSRLMWDPPPPYSQPASAENLAAFHNATPASPPNAQGSFHVSPTRRPTTLADLMRTSNSGISSPSDETSNNSPAHFALSKDGTPTLVCGTGSLPLSHRLRRLPLGHVKSLDDVTEGTRESIEALFCDGKEISGLENKFPGHILQKFPSHDSVTQKLLTLKSQHLKSVSDPREVYGKSEQESELYFADVSSCISLRADGEDVLYYSEATSQKASTPEEKEAAHFYEQVRPNEEDEELDSHHTSDDTMIVHTSSSDHSLGVDTYSVMSPLTDQSSASPMVTDTDAYSCSYQTIASPQDELTSAANLNLQQRQQQHRALHPPPRFYPANHHHRNGSSGAAPFNDNDQHTCGSGTGSEPRYEIISDEAQKAPKTQTPTEESLSSEGFVVASSDLNGNLASAQRREIPVVRHAQRTNLSLPLQRVLPSSPSSPKVPELLPKTPEKEHLKRPESGKNRKKRFNERSPPSYSNSEATTPTDRRLQSVQDHLFNLKSVNV